MNLLIIGGIVLGGVLLYKLFQDVEKLRINGVFLVLLIAIVVGIPFVIVHSYQMLVSDELVATVRGIPIDTSHMNVEVTRFDSSGTRQIQYTYLLSGSHWELNGTLVAFQPWLLLAGGKNGFSLDALTAESDDANAHLVTRADISDGLSGVMRARNNLKFLWPVIRTAQETGVIEPADGVLYKIYIDPRRQMYAQHS